jgi:hypothetical protein
MTLLQTSVRFERSRETPVRARGDGFSTSLETNGSVKQPGNPHG